MNTTLARLIMVTGLVVLVQVGIHGIRSVIAAPEMLHPPHFMKALPIEWDAKDMKWRGVDQAPDPKIVPRIGAANEGEKDAEGNWVPVLDAKGMPVPAIVDRMYRDETNHAVKLHSARYDDPANGVYHSPTNCYRSQGWRKVGERKVTIHVEPSKGRPDIPDIQASMSTWERGADRIFVVFWYQVGPYVLYERSDLLGVRWKLRGQTWPPFYKVLLEIPATEDAAEPVCRLAGLVRKWLCEEMQPLPQSDSSAS